MSDGVMKKIIEPDHPISVLANRLSSRAEKVANMSGITGWEDCLAYLNACGLILAGQSDIPRDHALERMDGLREVMHGAYDLYDVKGEG